MERTTSDSEVSQTDFEVFLSFRGPDTRQGFTDVLYDHLLEGGIQVFRDNNELAAGNNIDLIFDAIKNSKICVPIFSKSFASSAWCLREVSKMVELNKCIVPIFYDVTPDEVKLESSLYVDQLREQEKKYGREQVEKWEEALVQVARIKGSELKETGFVMFSKKFRAEISLKLGLKQKYSINHLVEMTDQSEATLKLLNVDSPDVRFFGMYGMGGIGKTTLAKIIFNRISSSFDACSFLANIREEHSRKGLEYLQRKLLQDLNPRSSDKINTADWVDRMKRTLRVKSVLIVLDDVGERSHITQLVGDSSSFGSRSRIVITTRDERVLMNVAQASFGDEGNWKLSNRITISAMQIKGMNPKQAMQLFSRHAFGRDSPPEDYMSLSEDVISITGGLPLALEVIGSLLCGMSIEAWNDKVAKLKTIPAEQVQEKLMISYEELRDDEKEIFLDIACFFISEEKSNAIYMWEACGFSPNWAVPVLLAMSLVKITDDNKFWMHDQLRDLGRGIVRRKGYYNNPSSIEGSRMLTYEDALSALERKKGKEVVGLHLDGSSGSLIDFSSFGSLRFLEVTGEATFSGNFWRLPESIRWLSLSLNSPNMIAAIRSKFYAILRTWSSSYLMKLVILDLSGSRISDDWEGWILIQKLQNLKVLDLTWCHKLTRTPDFSKMVALEKLILRDCINLAKIHSSIGKLRKLKYLNLEYCCRLRELPKEVVNLEHVEQIMMKGTRVSKLPDSIGKLKNLQHLSLKYCSRMYKLPESIGDLRSLVHLDISRSRIFELPPDIGRLAKLEQLILLDCRCISRLSDSIGDLTSLVRLDLSDCYLIDKLPSSITTLVKLQRLSLQGCKKIVQIPDDFGNLESLVELDLSRTGIGVLPDSIGNLVRLEVINIGQTPVSVLPETIALLTHLQTLDLSECHCIARLPKVPKSLITLKIKASSLQQAPDLSELIQLTVLILDDVRRSGAHDGRLPQLGLQPFKFDAIRNLTKLVSLNLLIESLTFLPTKFSALTDLKFLTLRCPNLRHVPQFPSSLQYLALEGVRGETKLPCFSNMKNLCELKFEDCCVEGGMQSLGVERLESLTRLTLCKCDTINKFPDLSCLKCLAVLEVYDCEELVEIPGLGTLISLERLIVSGCGSLESLENIKYLTTLETLIIKDCKSFRGIEGREELCGFDFKIQGCKCKDINLLDPFVQQVVV